MDSLSVPSLLVASTDEQGRNTPPPADDIVIGEGVNQASTPLEEEEKIQEDAETESALDDVPPPPSTAAPSTAATRSGTPTMASANRSRAQTMRNNTEAIMAAIQAQKRQGMGETVANALHTAQSLVSCDDESREHTLRSRLQTLLYGAGGGPNMSTERKSRAVLDSLEDMSPSTQAGGIRHPLEDFFSGGSKTQVAYVSSEHAGNDGSGIGSVQHQNGKDRKGRSRGLTQYQPYRETEKMKRKNGEFVAFHDDTSGEVPEIKVVDVEGDENSSGDDTSRAPSELDRLGRRLKTYTPKRMVFPMVEKSKALIRQLKEDGDGSQERRRAESESKPAYDPPPAHRQRHTQRTPRPTNRLPTDSTFAPLILPETAVDDYAVLERCGKTDFKSFNDDDEGDDYFDCDGHGSPPPQRSRRNTLGLGRSQVGAYSIQQHEFYVPSAGIGGVGEYSPQRQPRRRSLSAGVSRAPPNIPYSEALNRLSIESSQRIRGYLEANAIATMIHESEELEGGGGMGAGGKIPVTTVTPSLEDYLVSATAEASALASSTGHVRSTLQPSSRLACTVVAADGIPTSIGLTQHLQAIQFQQGYAASPFRGERRSQSNDRAHRRRSGTPSQRYAAGSASPNRHSVDVGGEAQRYPGERQFNFCCSPDVSEPPSTAHQQQMSPAQQIRARYAHLFVKKGESAQSQHCARSLLSEEDA